MQHREQYYHGTMLGLFNVACTVSRLMIAVGAGVIAVCSSVFDVILKPLYLLARGTSYASFK